MRAYDYKHSRLERSLHEVLYEFGMELKSIRIVEDESLPTIDQDPIIEKTSLKKIKEKSIGIEYQIWATTFGIRSLYLKRLEAEKKRIENIQLVEYDCYLDDYEDETESILIIPENLERKINSKEIKYLMTDPKNFRECLTINFSLKDGSHDEHHDVYISNNRISEMREECDSDRNLIFTYSQIFGSDLEEHSELSFEDYKRLLRSTLEIITKHNHPA
jgi:hypothetical protein